MTETIHEDDNLAAFNKPPGVNFDWVLAERPALIPVHRLDKDTSGVIVFAKNQATADAMKILFQTREIKKTYAVLVVGTVKNDAGVINLPIGRSKKTPLKRVAVGEQRGAIREAVTEYKVKKRYKDFTWVTAMPKTGRTHQIRSHFAAIGHPVVCDKLYAGKRFVCPGGITRQFLHAQSIEFTAPGGSRLMLEAEMPDDLENTLHFLTKSDGT